MRDDENLQTLETSPAEEQEPIVDAETTSESFDIDMDTPADVTPPPRTP